MPSFNNSNPNTRHIKKQESMVHPRENINKTTKTETVAGKDQMAELPEKEFQVIVLKMLKELKGDMETVEKMMYVQNQKRKGKKT